MLSNGVHSHGEGQKMTRHNKNKKNNITSPQKLTPNSTGKNLTRISHGRNLRVLPLHLAHDVPRIRGQHAQANQDDNSWDEA